MTGRWKGIVNPIYFLFIVLVFLYDYAYNAVSCLQSEHCTGLISKFAIPPIIHFSSFLCGAYYFRGRNGMDTSRGLIEAVFLQSTRTYALPASCCHILSLPTAWRARAQIGHCDGLRRLVAGAADAGTSAVPVVWRGVASHAYGRVWAHVAVCASRVGVARWLGRTQHSTVGPQGVAVMLGH